LPGIGILFPLPGFFLENGLFGILIIAYTKSIRNGKFILFSKILYTGYQKMNVY